jgi:hypothetical protein
MPSSPFVRPLALPRADNRRGLTAGRRVVSTAGGAGLVSEQGAHAGVELIERPAL